MCVRAELLQKILLVDLNNDSLVDLTDCIERGVYSHRLVRDLSDLPMRLAKFTNRKFLESLNNIATVLQKPICKREVD